jgi:chromate transporter
MLELFLVFMYIGAFALGGGLVAIPLIQQTVVARGWISEAEFTAMIAVAESTPGPIGLNISTYVGYTQYGFLVALVSTAGFVTPPILITMLISSIIIRHKDSPLIKNIFYFLKAALVGLILFSLVQVALFTIFQDQTSWIIDWNVILLLGILTPIYLLLRKHPLVVIGIGALLGLIVL